MRCPKCDQWNRASLPRCIRCGAELTDSAIPEWRKKLRDEPAKEYIRVDEDGAAIAAPDDREVLAAEMAELKARKEAGELLQQQMAEEATARQYIPSSQVHGGYRDAAPQDPFFGLAVEGVTRKDPPRAQAAPDQQDAPAAAGSTPYRRSRNPKGTRVVLAPQQWQDSRSYDPVVDDMMANAVYQPLPDNADRSRFPSRRQSRHRAIRSITLLLVLGVMGLVGYFAWSVYDQVQAAEAEKNRPLITASMVNDQAAHTILIPGQDGETIFISNEEIIDSFPVVGGFATIEIPDYIWYENDAVVVEETRTISLIPYRKTTSGRQTPMAPITYEISIPLSPITLITPTTSRTTVATAMYSIELKVRPESRVSIYRPTEDGKGQVIADVSDTVNEDGSLTYNANIHPIGDNVFEIHVRSPYCRENTISVVLYRDYQEIPLDLSATTYTRTNNQIIPITCKTIPGAEITILSSHSDLKITNLDKSGEFTFNAIFDHIGYNTISIQAAYTGKKTSQLDYVIYYVPNPDKYTTAAWPLHTADDYAELMSNISVRAANSQVYVAKGVIDHFINEDGTQMAVMYCSTDGKTQPVLLENQTRTTWKVGEYYSIYADAYGTYNNMPWLIARYTY